MLAYANKIKQVFASFKTRGGYYVFSSMLFSKIINFILSIIIVRLLAEEIYGNISYAFSILQILLPLAGFGLHYTMLRFGAIEKERNNKNNLFITFLSKGFVYSLIIMVLLIILSPFITQRLPGSNHYLRLFSPLIITFYISELLFSYFRIQKNNRLYSIGLGLKSILMLIICSLAAYYFRAEGYIVAYVFVPLVVFISMFSAIYRKYQISYKLKDHVHISPYLKYGLWVGLGSIASQLVILIDTIMVANIIADSVQVAIYKVATIIPVNLLFLPMVLLKTDYVYIAENHSNKKFLLNYYKKYLFIFFSILIVILAGWFLFSDIIMLMFGGEYTNSKSIINILMLMVAGAFLMRVPLGNMLNALGKSKWNSISNIILLSMNIVLNTLLIPKYGLYGAAYASVISVWISGIINVFLYFFYLKRYTT